MTYSRRRLFFVGLMWVAVGTFLFGGHLFLGVDAEPDCPGDFGDSPDPTTEPCAWPATSYDGGITLGAPLLDGQELALFAEEEWEDSSDVDYQIDPLYDRDPAEACELSPGASSWCADISTVGFDIGEGVTNLFLHKTWKTEVGSRDLPSTWPDESDYDDVYIYIQATEAQLDGPSGDEYGIDCRERDVDDDRYYHPDHCDLVAEIAEVSFGDLWFHAEADTALGTADLTDQQIDNIDDSPDNGFWVNEPREDLCDVEDVWTTAWSWPPIDLDGFCLALVDPSFPDRTDAYGFDVIDDVSIEQLVFFDLMVRGHGFRAVPPNDPQDPAQDKILRLGRPNDPDSTFYAEIRWGKGHDRAITPPSVVAGDADRDTGTIDPAEPGTHRFAAPAFDPVGSDSSDPVLRNSQVSGLANMWECVGNPTFSDDTGDHSCERSFSNSGTLRHGAYDDIYETG